MEKKKQVGAFVHTTAGVRHGYRLPPVLFNIFLENIIRKNPPRSSHFHFHRWEADLQPAFCRRHRSDSKQQQRWARLYQPTDRACEMKTRTDKKKVMVTGRDKTETYLNGVLLEEVKRFQYLGAILSKHGSSIKNIHIRIEQQKQRQWVRWTLSVVAIPLLTTKCNLLKYL